MWIKWFTDLFVEDSYNEYAPTYPGDLQLNVACDISGSTGLLILCDSNIGNYNCKDIGAISKVYIVGVKKSFWHLISQYKNEMGFSPVRNSR